MRKNGEIVDRQTLLAVLPGAAGEHAVEMAVARLRTTLGAPRIVETIVKRGYRVAVTAYAAARSVRGPDQSGGCCRHQRDPVALG